METKPATEEKKAPPVSRGEQIFDWLVYGGIAGVGVFLATIPTTYWAKYGGGAKYFKAGAHKLQQMGLSEQTAEHVLVNTALMQAGNAALIPIKWAEDQKASLVTRINDALGEKTDTAALEAEDKQTWGSIIKARAVTWLVVFASLKTAVHTFGEGKFAAFENGFAKRMCSMLGKPTHLHGQETKMFHYGKIAALDVFATAAASTLLYVGSRVFAHWERQENEAGHHDATPHTTAHEENILPQKSFATAVHSKNGATHILKTPPAEGFASAAIASRTGEALQLGA